jgi:hypothetical protein
LNLFTLLTLTLKVELPYCCLFFCRGLVGVRATSSSALLLLIAG